VVEGDAIKPIAEFRLTPEPGQSFDDLEQDFLCGILGVGTAMEHTEGKIEEPGKMAREEQIELIAAASLCPGYEFFVRIAQGSSQGRGFAVLQVSFAWKASYS
jgi:hypothetical protein